MLFRYILPAFLLIGIGCSADPADGVSDDNLTQAALNVQDVAERAECLVANGRNAVETYDPATFDPAETMKQLRADNRDYGCPKAGTSTSREDAVKQFKDFLVESEPMIGDCEEPAKLKQDLLELFEDPTNKAVFASFPVDGSGDDEVHCYIHKFDVYRADGKVVRFDFDWSD